MKKVNEKEIRSLADDGKKYTQIMAITGISRYYIKKILETVYSKPIDLTNQKIIDSFDTDRSVQQISDCYNISNQKVYQIWKKQGLSAKNRNQIYTILSPFADRVHNLSQDGKSYIEITAITGLSKYHIEKILSKGRKEKKDQKKQEIINLFYTNQSVRQISNSFNISYTHIYRIWEKHGLIVKNRNPLYDIVGTFADQIRSLSKDGKSYIQIIAITGLSKYRIKKIVGKKSKEIRDQRKQEIINLFYTNKSVSQISDCFNISHTYIYKIWERQDLLLKDREKILNDLDPLTGKIFGSWEILQKVWVDNITKKYSHNRTSINRQNRNVETFYECKCQKCNNTVKAIRRHSLINGLSRSCRSCATIAWQKKGSQKES